jgi:hypothetical protein
MVQILVEILLGAVTSRDTMRCIYWKRYNEVQLLVELH